MENPSLILPDCGVWPRIRAESRAEDRLMNVVELSMAELFLTNLPPEKNKIFLYSKYFHFLSFSLTVGVDDILPRLVDPAEMVPGPLREAHLKLPGLAWDM